MSGAGSTYVVTFDAVPAVMLNFVDTTLRVDEVQTLTLNASDGTFRLTLNDGADVTDPLSATVDANTLKTQLQTLTGVSNVTVVKDETRPFYTILFTGPGGENVNQLEVTASTLSRSVKDALETNLDIAITEPDDLKGFTAEITRGLAKNKFRVVIGGSDPDFPASAADGLTVLEIARPWEAGLTEQVPSFAGGSEFTLEKTNPNLLVDENEETDFFFLDDTDNVTSIQELPTAALVVEADHLTGLGMGGDQVIGGRLPGDPWWDPVHRARRADHQPRVG